MAGESYEIWVKKSGTKPDEGWEQVVDEKGEGHFFGYARAERIAKAKSETEGLSEVVVIERRPIIRINASPRPPLAPPPAKDGA